jgi:hypothetical protein
MHNMKEDNGRNEKENGKKSNAMKKEKQTN